MANLFHGLNRATAPGPSAIDDATTRVSTDGGDDGEGRSVKSPQSHLFLAPVTERFKESLVVFLC